MRLVRFVVILGLTGCATVSSSLQYTQGTNALERGDFPRAAELLTEAVRLDPDVSRNRNNLAAALFELGRLDEGWWAPRDPKSSAFWVKRMWLSTAADEPRAATARRRSLSKATASLPSAISCTERDVHFMKNVPT
jgi:tetratricopeptide (TPR) repeat protein